MGQNSESARKMWADEEYRQKVIQGTAAGKATKESKTKRSEIMKELWKDPEYRNSVLDDKPPPPNKIPEEKRVVKTCPTCKNEFSVLPCRSKRKWCSKKCRSEGEFVKGIIPDKHCESCEKDFTPNSWHQVCCKKCVPNVKASQRWKKFKMNQQDYDNMWSDQQDRCKICPVILSSLKQQQVHLDHCHTTGKVRGILCNRCNFLVGIIENHGELLAPSYVYIDNAKKLHALEEGSKSNV